MVHNRPDTKDSERFKYHTAEPAQEVFEFTRSEKNYGDELKINDWTTDLPVYKSILDKAKDGPTLGMTIIRNDSVLFEYYREDIQPDDLLTSYSVAKSFVSAMIGIAISEGKIKSVDQLAVEFVPELKADKQFSKVTIKHLLNHTSGIKGSLPLEAKLYYGSDAMKTILDVKFEHEPGTHQAYVNLNSQLLGLILSRATGVSVSKYLEEKIWQPIGAKNEARWSTDDKNEMEKTYCCLNASLMDYAKFGRLFLNEGNWNGKQVVPEEWVRESIARNDEDGSSHGYNYSWHIGLKEYGDYSAAGLFEQYVYIVPKKNLVIALFNEHDKSLEMERVNWPYIFRQLTDLL